MPRGLWYLENFIFQRHQHVSLEIEMQMEGFWVQLESPTTNPWMDIEHKMTSPSTNKEFHLRFYK